MKFDWKSLSLGLASLAMGYGMQRIADPKAASWTDTKNAAVNMTMQWGVGQLQQNLAAQAAPQVPAPNGAQSGSV